VYAHGFEDMRRRKPDLSKLREAINYQPEYSLNDILNDVINYHKRNEILAGANHIVPPKAM
jgi:UDP-glucose 4-epimerase